VTLCPFLTAEGREREPGEVSLALLPTRRCGEAFLGRAGPSRESGAAWPGDVSRPGSSAPLTRTGCASLSTTVTGYVRYLSTERFQTAPRPLQSVVKQPAVCAMLAAPPPHPHARTQAAGWEQLPAQELAAALLHYETQRKGEQRTREQRSFSPSSPC